MTGDRYIRSNSSTSSLCLPVEGFHGGDEPAGDDALDGSRGPFDGARNFFLLVRFERRQHVLDDGTALQVDEVVVPRDELCLVHATGPRGNAARRRHTLPKYVAMKVGPYEVQGFIHGLPGADPIVSIRRRKTMIPLTDVRITFVVNGEHREDHVDSVILNRERIEWIAVVEPDRAAVPVRTDPLETRRPGTT